MGRRFYPWFDSSNVPAVQRAKMEQSKEAKAWIREGVPLNDVIRAFDLPFPEHPWGETWHRPIGLVDVKDDYVPGDDDPDGSGETGLLSGPPTLSPGARAAEARQQRAERAGARVGGMDERTRARLWQQWRGTWAGLERAVLGKIKRHFRNLRKTTLERLYEALPAAPDTPGRASVPDSRRDLLGEVLFDLVEANGGLIELVGPLLRESYRLGGEQSMREAAEAAGSDPDDAEPFHI